MTRVWVTRPDPLGAATAHSLTLAGYQVVCEPLLFYELVEPLPSLSGAFSCVVLTSRMAVRAMPEKAAGIEPLLAIPCYCVGAQTAEAAQAFGFSVVHVGQGDAKALGERILADGHTNALHLCAEDHGPEPSQTLMAGGCRLQQVPLYRMQAAMALSQEIIERLQRETIQAVLFYSPRTAACFVRCMKAARLEACCRSLIAVGLSQAVRADLDGIAFQAVVASASPSEESLLACLKDVCPP